MIQSLMEMDCIPSGMELFPAADEDQFEFIKKVIDDCDYYLLIIGGRYGSTTSEGVSYTEKEYEYAISKGLKVIALLHQEPDNIPAGKTDKDAELAKRLEEFREKVQEGRLVKYWNKAEELPGIVALSLLKMIKTYPAIGWVRGNAAASTEMLEEINELRKKNAELQAALDTAAPLPSLPLPDIAGLDVVFDLSGTYQTQYNGQHYRWTSSITFGQMFALIGPYLIEHPSDGVVKTKLGKSILSLQGEKPYNTEIDDQSFQTFKIQLHALGLIDLRYTSTTKGGMALFWSLTKIGTQTMVLLRAVRKVE